MAKPLKYPQLAQVEVGRTFNLADGESAPGVRRKANEYGKRSGKHFLVEDVFPNGVNVTRLPVTDSELPGAA